MNSQDHCKLTGKWTGNKGKEAEKYRNSKNSNQLLPENKTVVSATSASAILQDNSAIFYIQTSPFVPTCKLTSFALGLIKGNSIVDISGRIENRYDEAVCVYELTRTVKSETTKHPAFVGITSQWMLFVYSPPISVIKSSASTTSINGVYAVNGSIGNDSYTSAYATKWRADMYKAELPENLYKCTRQRIYRCSTHFVY